MTQDTDTEFTESVVAVIDAIPEGTVTTYGEIAAEAGHPGAARAVGNLLRATPGLPWWRVIAASGRLVPEKEADHAQRLRAEGVRIMKGKVVMKGSK